MMSKGSLTSRVFVMATVAFLASALMTNAENVLSQNAAADGQLVNVGGHKLFCRLLGNGTPLVVLEPGITETFRTWETINAKLAELTTVLVYDRAGYGQSDAGPLPRTSAEEVIELAQLLDKAGNSTRVVLVGHSLGGINMLIFASKYPDRVAGVAVLDPPPADFVMGRKFVSLRKMANQMTQQFKVQAATQRKNGNGRQAAFFEAVASEHDAIFGGLSGREYDKIKTLGNIPLMVLSSEKANLQMGESAEGFQKFWIQSNERVSRLSRNGKFILATNASHHIHLDAPGTVIQAIRQLVELERNNGNR